MNGVRYKCHPVYDLYAASKCDRIIHIKRRKPLVGNVNSFGYLKCIVRRSNYITQKCYRVYRYVWKTDGYVVDHVNNNKTDNRLSNLQLLTRTTTELKKYHKDFHIKRSKKRGANEKNLASNKVSFYVSMSAAGNNLLIQPKCIYDGCIGKSKHHTRQR